MDESSVSMYADGLSNGTLQSFTSKHEIASYGTDIWSKSFDGESPVTTLAQTIGQTLATDCATIATARELAVDTAPLLAVPATSSGTATDAYAIWNAQLATLKDEIRDALLAQDDPDETALRAAFNRIDPEVLDGGDATFEAIRITGAEPDARTVQQATATSDLAAAVDSVRNVLSGASIDALSLDSRTASKDDTESQRLIALLSGSQPGDTVRDGGDWLIVTAKTGDEPLAYEQAPRLARVQYANERLAELVARHASDGTLRITGDLEEVVARLMTS